MARPIHVALVFTHSYAYYRGVLRGVRRYLEGRPDWLVTMLMLEQHPLHIPGRKRPDGLISTMDTEQILHALSVWRRPVVDVSAMFPNLAFPRVGVDYVRVGQLAATHFLERGLRHFGYVGPSHQLHVYSTECQAAFARTLAEAGHAVDTFECPINPPFDPPGVRWDLGRPVERWLVRLPKPAGVFVPNDFWGVQVSEACRRAGLRVPEDVALLGSNNDEVLCQLTRPPLSSIVLPAEQIGYQAAALLERLLRGGKPPRTPILLPPTGIATRRSTEVLAIDDDEVVAALRFIRDNAHQSLCVGDVLREVPVGRRTLERRCRKLLGWGLGAEIRRTRLERACRLLAETDLTMQAVALQAGFTGFRQLGVMFRKGLGMCPTEYRHRMRNPADAADGAPADPDADSHAVSR